jgi:hypothetical protein
LEDILTQPSAGSCSSNSCNTVNGNAPTPCKSPSFTSDSCNTINAKASSHSKSPFFSADAFMLNDMLTKDDLVNGNALTLSKSPSCSSHSSLIMVNAKTPTPSKPPYIPVDDFKPMCSMML